MMDMVYILVGRVTGGLAMVCAFSSCLFGFVTGSSIADVAAIGSITMPTMVKRGYSKGFAASLQAAAGVLGGIIPPSISLVILGCIGGVSIRDLLLAAIVPGWLFGVCLMVTAYIISRKRNYKGREEHADAKEMWRAACKAFLPLMTPVIVLGGMYSGVFTPTEAAGVAVVYAFLLSVVIYRTIKIRDLYRIFREAVVVSISVLCIIACGATFSWLMATYQAPQIIKEFFLSITTNPMLMMFLVNVLLFILGMVMETSAIIIIFVPVLLPLMTSLGWDPVQFGIIFTLNLALGAVTPPVGVAAMMACKIIDTPYPPPLREWVPFVAAMAMALGLIICFPPLTLWLVHM